MTQLKASGIYQITNRVNGKVYIGSSINIHKRWVYHKNHLRKNKHDNCHLQSAWNKYGESSFECVALEYCENDKNILEKLEDKWIVAKDAMNPSIGYNLIRAERNKGFSAETIRKISEAGKGRIVSPETCKKISELKLGQPRFFLRKYVYQFDMEGKLAGFWHGKKDAANSTEHSESSILYWIKSKSFNEFGFRFEHGPKPTEQVLSQYQKSSRPPNDKTVLITKKVYQYSINGVLLNIFLNTADAGKQLGLNPHTISGVCNSNFHTLKGYIFRYELLSPEVITRQYAGSLKTRGQPKKKIYQYSLDGELLNTFFGLKAAVKQTNGELSGISRCCLGKLNTSGGFIFKYHLLPKDIIRKEYLSNKTEPARKVVYQYSKNGQILNKFLGLKDAAEKTNCAIDSISRCCLGKIQTLKGFIFRYESDAIVEKLPTELTNLSS